MIVQSETRNSTDPGGGIDTSVLRSPLLRAAVEIWDAARQPGETLPLKERLDIVGLGRAGLMPIMWLVEREVDGTWRYRVSGESINAIHGRSLAGRTIGDVADPAKVADISRRWSRCIDERVILHTFGRIFGLSGTHSGERVVLPLLGEGPGTAYVLGITDGRLARALPSDALANADRPTRGHENDVSDWIPIAPR